MNRIGLKIVCLVASVVIWMNVASNSIVEQTTKLPLRVTGVGDGLTYAGSDLPSQVKVRVRGSKWRLLTHNYFNSYIGRVQVDVRDRAAGPTFSYELDQNDVVATDLEVLGIQPPMQRLRIKLDHKVQRKLPVWLSTSGNLPTDVAYLTEPIVVPDSVMVTGPERFFPASGVVRTEDVALGQFHSSDDVTVSLIAPHQHLTMASKDVRAMFRVAAVEDRTMANIPVIPLVDAGQPEVGVSPPVVDVMVRGVADSVAALPGDRIAVTLPVGHLEPGVHMVTGQVDVPPWLTVIGLDPAEFQVVIGHVDPIKADSLRTDREDPRE